MKKNKSKEKIFNCPVCEGEGKIHNSDYEYVCQRCGGTGIVDCLHEETINIGDEEHMQVACTICEKIL